MHSTAKKSWRLQIDFQLLHDRFNNIIWNKSTVLIQNTPACSYKKEWSLFIAVISASERKPREYQVPENWATGVKQSGKGELNPPVEGSQGIAGQRWKVAISQRQSLMQKSLCTPGHPHSRAAHPEGETSRTGREQRAWAGAQQTLVLSPGNLPEKY